MQATQGQTETKRGEVHAAMDQMAKEVEAIHAITNRLITKLEPVRLEREEGPENSKQKESPQRSFVVRRLFEVADKLTEQRQRLETLTEEVEL